MDKVYGPREGIACAAAGGVLHNLEARLGAATCLNARWGAMREVANGLLAAWAENPHWSTGSAQVHKDQWQMLKTTWEDPAAAMIGLACHRGARAAWRCMSLSPVTSKDRTTSSPPSTTSSTRGSRGNRSSQKSIVGPKSCRQ